jgi:outer membrane protein OmpA-like peptidoglycan-associated protein
MRSKFLAIIVPSLALAGCAGGMDDDFYVAGPVAPPGKYIPEVYVPDIALDEDFFAAAGTNTVFFDTDESVLTPQSRDVLERQALWLITHRDVNFKIEGHADERATSTYNLGLGRRRAEAVKDVIDKFGDIQVNRRAVTVLD